MFLTFSELEFLFPPGKFVGNFPQIPSETFRLLVSMNNSPVMMKNKIAIKMEIASVRKKKNY